MPEDSSLTEFTETDDDQSTTSTDVDAGGKSTDADEATVTVTFAWDGTGKRCADCGEAVARRWTDDGRLVCADCKCW